MLKYYINSNNGDYIEEMDGEYTLHLRSRYEGDKFIPYKSVKLTLLQFNLIKGFVPIKVKKLYNVINNYRKYRPTINDGTKGESGRTIVPSISDAREESLKKIGL